LKKAFVCLVAIVAAPAILVGLAAFAAGDWRPIGETSRGDRVSVSSVRLLKKAQRTAWVRVEYKEPVKLPQGGPFVEMRARVRWDCASGNNVPLAVWFYSRDRSGKFVVSKKTTHDEQFGKDPEGGFEGMVRKNVCENK
jgi:Surface-adhesin protein E